MSRESDLISSILTGLGWDDSLAVPIANEENKRLLHLIDLKQKQTSNNKSELERLNDKLDSMMNHLKNCRQELQQSLQLKNARIEQNRSEDHSVKVIERERGRLAQENKRTDSRLRDMVTSKGMFENTLFAKTAEIERLRTEMRWDQQALEAWLEESEKKLEDQLSLEKYARQDEQKARELSEQLERCTGLINEKRTVLEREVVETRTAQVELEKTSEEWTRAAEARAGLLAQWDATIDQLRRRDREIDQLTLRLEEHRADFARLEETMRSRQQFFDNLVTSNADIERQIDAADRQAGKLRSEQRQTETDRFNFQNELEALKRTCDRTAVDLEHARVAISQLKKEKVEKEERKMEAVSKRMELEERLKRVGDDKISAEEKANIADRMLEEEEKSHLKFEQLLKHTRDLQFKKAQELHEAEVAQRNIVAEMHGNSTAVKNMNGSIHKLDHALLKQQEILYNQDFSIQQLERRINRMHGDHSNEEKEALEEKIKQLTENLEATVKVVATLTAQTKKAQDDTRRCKYDMEKIKNEHGKVTEKLEEVNLQNDTSQQELKKTRGDKEKTMVEDNIMKLEVKRLRDRLYNKAEQVLNLDKKKLLLEQAVKERFAEIRIHKDMLMLQIRSADEEKSKINSDLKSRLSKIDKLEKRFEILTVSMAPPEGEEEQSQAYYVIKAAQDKEALQRQGDELDAKIRKSEKEIRALENTLILMNTCNQKYRQSMAKVSDTSAEQATKNDLQTQLRTVMEKYNFKKRQLEQLEDDYQTLKETLENLNKDEILYGDQVSGILEQMSQKERERDKQMEKIERAENMIIRLRHEILESELSDQFELVESDVKAKDKKEFNRIVINEVLRCIQNHYPDLSSTVKQYLDIANLIPGTPASSVKSSSGSTARSSVVSKPSPISTTRSSTSCILSSVGSRQSSRTNLSVVQMGFNETASPGGSVSSKRSGTGIKSPASSTSSSKTSTTRSSKKSVTSQRGSRIG